MTRICWLIDSLGPGGAEALTPRFVRAAIAAGLEPVVVTLRRSRHAPHLSAVRAAGVEPTCLGARNLRDPGALRRLLRHLREACPELVHAHLNHASLWGLVATGLTRTPIIATFHELPHGPRVPLRERLVQAAMARLASWRKIPVIAVSRFAADAYADRGWISPSRIHVVPNTAPAVRTGLDPARRRALRRELGVPPDGPVLITVAVLRPDKGVDVAVRALRGILRSTPSSTLLVVGSGPEEPRLRQLAGHVGVGDRCRFLGHRQDMEELYGIADLLVHPSRREALPTVVLEAMAAGLPVVATDVGGTAEIVGDGITGLLVPPDSPEALATATGRLLENPERARSMGGAGRERAADELGPARWIERLRAVYGVARQQTGSSAPAAPGSKSR